MTTKIGKAKHNPTERNSSLDAQTRMHEVVVNLDDYSDLKALYISAISDLDSGISYFLNYFDKNDIEVISQLALVKLYQDFDEFEDLFHDVINEINAPLIIGCTKQNARLDSGHFIDSICLGEYEDIFQIDYQKGHIKNKKDKVNIDKALNSILTGFRKLVLAQV